MKDKNKIKEEKKRERREQNKINQKSKKIDMKIRVKKEY